MVNILIKNHHGIYMQMYLYDFRKLYLNNINDDSKNKRKFYGFLCDSLYRQYDKE